MKGKNKKTYRRKKLDIVKTLKAYENRIMSLPRGEFEVLRDKYISSYEVWDTFQNDEILQELRMRHGTKFDNIAFRLYLVARVKGIPLKGITSQKKEGDKCTPKGRFKIKRIITSDLGKDAAKQRSKRPPTDRLSRAGSAHCLLLSKRQVRRRPRSRFDGVKAEQRILKISIKARQGPQSRFFSVDQDQARL